MEKIPFYIGDTSERQDFYVLEQTKQGGFDYILVTDSIDDDGECLILKDTGTAKGAESVYEPVEDETELLALSKVFEELLEDVDIEL